MSLNKLITVCVLDVGTGSGRVALGALKLMGGKGCVIGVDILRNTVERAYQRGVKEGSYLTVFLQGCCERLPFRDEVFDAVYSNFGLAHFRNPCSSLDEMIRVLKRGGRVGVADYKHPTYMDVHPLFREPKPPFVVGWITERLRWLGCRAVSVPFVEGNFYVVIGVK